MYSGRIRHHPLKILLHDVTTRIFCEEIVDATGLSRSSVHLIDYTSCGSPSSVKYKGGESLKSVPSTKGSEWYMYDAVDITLNRAANTHCKRHGIALTWFDTPLFIASMDELLTIHKDKFASGNKRLLQTTFYSELRRNHHILMTDDGKWVGNKLTFDVENRKPLPRGQEATIPDFRKSNGERSATERRMIREGIERLRHYFKDHPGIDGDIDYSHIDFTRAGALKRLARFCRERLVHFGDYQDAMVASFQDMHTAYSQDALVASSQDALTVSSQDSNTSHVHDNFILYHSGISHLLNIGLLTPMDVVDKVIEEWSKNRDTIPIASVEGFIRQVIGWREYSRYIYVFWGEKIRAMNAMKATRKLTSAWYDGTTGWTPVDMTIRQAFRTGYLHHIQRLMVMGNIMNLMQFHPHEVYRWFMEFAIDSYEWVMVYNVYSMILYADGGLTTTKPYISSSAYLYKMSNGRFRRDGIWDEDWTTLFYAYIGKHREVFEKNGRTVQMWNLWNRKTTAEQREIKRNASAIIARLSD